jgi:Glycosyl transferase family 2
MNFRRDYSGGSVAEEHLKISIVTPSYNQACFLEDTILSVVSQNYPNIEYVIIDGGSSDASVDIIRKYEAQLAYWVSEPDKGHIDALNKGFARTTGEIMGWINSDDKYAPWAFSVIEDIFSSFPHVEWVSTLYPIHWNAKGQAAECKYSGGFNRASFLRGANLPRQNLYGRAWIQQESTFWRRSLWERAGGYIDTSLNFDLAPDFELWARFYQHAELHAVATPVGGFRKHGHQKTAQQMEKYVTEAERVLHRYGGKSYGRIQSVVRSQLWRILGSRSLKGLPRVMGYLLTRARILYPVKVFVWMDGEWKIIVDYVV